MGGYMAGHLLRAGHNLTVHNRTRSKADDLLGHGAVWAETPGDAARGAEMVGVMVGYPGDVDTVMWGENGVLEAAPRGAIIVDFTTSRPALAERLAEAGARRGLRVLDAPVSGGDVGARNAALSIMVGGNRADFEAARPVLELLGRTVVHHGPAGSGQHAKLVNQILIAGNMIGVCEGLIYARANGLDPDTVLQSVGGGAAASWSLSHLAPRMLKGDFAPGFLVEHFIKDLELALEECERMGLRLPGLELAHRLYRELAEIGGSRQGTQALLRVLEPRGRIRG